MKLQLIEELVFDNQSDLKFDSRYLSIKEPGFDKSLSTTKELCRQFIKTPRSISRVFNPNKKKLVVHLSKDIDNKKMLVCYVNHSE